jgi:hypothetical protein
LIEETTAMALAQALNDFATDTDDRRWREWWAHPTHDMQLGAALLDVYEGWDGDDSAVTAEVHSRFVALDRRLMAYEDWCARRGVEPTRQPGPAPVSLPTLRLVDADNAGSGDRSPRCPDCSGSGIDVDLDGSVTGRAGTLVECVCSEPERPLRVRAAETALGRPLTRDERCVALAVEHVTRSSLLGLDPGWCPDCGRPTGQPDDDRCTCRPLTLATAHAHGPR